MNKASEVHHLHHDVIKTLKLMLDKMHELDDYAINSLKGELIAEIKGDLGEAIMKVRYADNCLIRLIGELAWSQHNENK